MKVFLKNGLLFLVASIAVYLALFGLLSKVNYGGIPLIYRAGQALNWKGGNSYVKFRQFDRNRNYDAVFIGSSHAYRGYDMAVFKNAGLEVFNLGSSAQTPMNTRWIMNDLITENNTGLVVIDVFNGALETDGLESTADLTQNYPTFNPVLNMVWHMKDPRGINMLLLRLLQRNAPPMYEEECVGTSGSCLISDSVSTPDFQMDRKLNYNPDQLRALETSVKWLKGMGVPVLLVDHPVPPDSDIGRQREHTVLIDSLSSEWGVPFYDMTLIPGFDSRDHFYDHTHLNSAGATLFSKHLLARMSGDERF